MNKLAILLTVVIVTGFTSVQMMDSQPEVSVYSWADAQATQDRITTYKCFKHTLEATIEELRRGSIRLKEAQSRVLAAARHYYPEFLVHLCLTEPGATDEERVARNLIEHVDNWEDFPPPLGGGPADLMRQLQELLDELNASAKRR